VARKPTLVPLRGRFAMTAQPVFEPMADNDQRAAIVAGRFGMRQRLRFKRLIVLTHGFERAQKIPTRRRDLPSFVIAHHVPAAEDIDDGDSRRETLEARGPVRPLAERMAMSRLSEASVARPLP
jgi:hypothetical protein